MRKYASLNLLRLFLIVIASVIFTVVVTEDVVQALPKGMAIHVYPDSAWFQKKADCDAFGALVEYSDGGDTEVINVTYKVMHSEKVYQRIPNSIFNNYNDDWQWIGGLDSMDPHWMYLFNYVAYECVKKRGNGDYGHIIS